MDARMHASFAFDRPRIAAGAAAKVDLVLAFSASGQAARRGLNLSLVIDHSGSMAGAPLKSAIKAASQVAQRLHEDDWVSVVAYDDSADTVVAPQKAADKAAIVASIGKIRAAGCTNLSAGWEAGASHVRKNVGDERTSRVLLLTDGQANMGITDPKRLVEMTREKAAAGISTTTLGFGSGFHEDLLVGMASSGEGNFYFIQSPEDLEEVFRIEVEGLSSVAAQGLEVVIRPEPGVRVASVLGKFASSEIDGAIRVSVGDVYGGEPKHLALELEIEGGPAGPRKLASVRYACTTGGIKAFEDVRGELDVTVEAVPGEAGLELDKAVVGRTGRLRAARAKDDAVRLADRGELEGAARRLREAAEALRASPAAEIFEVAEEIDYLEHYADKLEKKNFGGELRKELVDQAYQGAKRSRGDLALRGTSAGSAVQIPVATSDERGVVLRCVREGGKLRVRVLADKYDQRMNVQFPRTIRQEGVTYLADDVVPSADGSFYRTVGEIRRLVRPGEVDVALAGASQGARRPAASKPAKAPKTAADLGEVGAVGDGVLVQCVKEGSKLRARVVSDGFNPDWNIRFPRSIRELGVLYVVDEVLEASGGGSYVASGEIKRLVQ